MCVCVCVCVCVNYALYLFDVRITHCNYEVTDVLTNLTVTFHHIIIMLYITLYTLNFHNVVCQLYLYKAGSEKKI